MTFSPFFLRFLAAIAIVAALVGVKRIVDSYAPKEVHRKDFIQEYCLGKGVVDGVDLYVGMPELAGRYFDPVPNIPWRHPAPHTPLAAVLSVPIGFFPYEVAATIWLSFEIVLLAIAVELLANWWGSVTRLQKVVLVLMSMGFGPVIHELWFGQFSMILLVSLLLSWLSLRRGADWAGGAFLGFAVALKLAAWPVGILLLLHGRWKAVLAAGIVVLVLNAFAGAIVGWPTLVKYYTEVGPTVARQHHLHNNNYSLWTVGGRLFSPEGGKVVPEFIASDFVAESLVSAPQLDDLLTRILPPLGLVVALVLAWRCRQFDSAFGILVCASLPLNPIAWDHYLLMTAIPIVVVFRRLKDAGFPKAKTAFALAGLAITVFPYPALIDGTIHFFTIEKIVNMPVLPFAPGLVTYAPLVALATWIALLWKTDSQTTPLAPDTPGERGRG